MEYFIIIILNFIFCIILISNGTLFKILFNLKNINENIIESGLYGFILISSTTFILNFFFKISNYLSLLLLILPIFFIYKKIFYLKNKIFYYSAIGSLISSLIMILDWTNRPDAGLYHLPYTNIINDSKIIFGVANLEFRFGHASILQYLSAAFNNQIFTNKGILIPLSNIFAFSVIYIFNLFLKNSGVLKIIFFLFLFNILYSMNRYSGFGNDDPAHMFFYLVICNYLITFYCKNNNHNHYQNIIFFSVFVFLIKPFLIFIFFIPLLLLISKKIKLISKVNIFCFTIILLWFLKNIIVSSCIIYPEPKFCFKSLQWTTINSQVANPSRVKRTSEAWSKDWPNKKGEITQTEYIKNFNWLKVWKNNHFKIVLKETVPQIIMIIILFMIIPSHSDNYRLNKKKSLTIFLFSFFCITVWFLKFPIYRYGQSYIILFLNSILILFLNLKIKNFNFNINNLNKFLSSILVILCIGVLAKNVIRINKNFNNKYIDYPWPKMNSFTDKNTKNKNIPVYSEDKKLLYFKPYPYTLCMSSESPCTSNNNVHNIKLRSKYGYKIYYYEN